MNINNYEFSNLTKEDLGVDLEKVINTHLFKLVRRCIENENIIFYDKATNRYGTCDEETYENYIKNSNTVFYTVSKITITDKFNILDEYLLSPEMKEENRKQDDMRIFRFLDEATEKEINEYNQKHGMLFKEFQGPIKIIFTAKQVDKIIKKIGLE